MAIIVLTASIAVAVSYAQLRFRQTSELRAIRTSGEANDLVLKLQLDEETGMRGFAVGGDRLFLAPYTEAAVESPAAFEKCARMFLTIGAPANRLLDHLAKMRSIHAQWEQIVARPVIERRVGLHDQRIQRRGKQLVDAYRVQNAGVSDELAQEAAASDLRSQIGDVALAGAVLLFALAVSLALRWFRRGLDLERQRRSDLLALSETIPQLVWRSDRRGNVTYWNAAWYVYTGLREEDSTGDKWLAAVHPDDVERTREDIRNAVHDSAPIQAEYRMRRHDGAYRWFLGRGVPLMDHASIGYFGTHTDIDEQCRARKRLETALEREQRASVAFQQAALPATLPSIAGLSFDAVYRAAEAEALVGGDWYDAFRLSDGRFVLSVGDVAGSGLAAA